jgi:putative SOS response-associated peptidase YedK
MCNLYSLTRSADEMRRVFRADRDSTGNLPSLPAIFPDQLAPVVRSDRDGARELIRMRWGFPPPPNTGSQAVTNVRNTKSPFWRAWLKPEFLCLVPLTSFREYTDEKPKVPHWFATDESRPLAAFAGIWRPWTGTRGTKAQPVEGEHLLYSFLTTEANAVERPIHAKAMPVILTRPDEWDAWLNAPVEEALQLQRPLPDDALQIVATGTRSDEAPQLA